MGIPSGIVCAALGIVGDGLGWWDDRSFLTNLLSSFTGLLIGVPFALVVLSHLGSLQAEAVAQQAARRRGLNTALEFEQIVLSGFRQLELDDAYADLIRLRTANQQFRQAVHAWPKTPSPASSLAVSETFERRHDAIQAAFTSRANSFVPWLTSVSEVWHRLDMEVRPRLEDAGVQWMARADHVALRSAVRVLDGRVNGRLMSNQGGPRRSLDRHVRGEPVTESALEKAIEHLRDDADAAHEVVVALITIRKSLPAVNGVAR
ncbi:hypothetical protein [Streptomyces sp. R302]|uniref:hypothetical protein n=1 Tax=Streptomyces sp. R302 TaxID=2728844 RepID=UPI00145D1395|nr:hypothetical protein [Streptomyces sp. R302]NML55178.1 hypothetical protein [Streptomyces sp. R301]